MPDELTPCRQAEIKSVSDIYPESEPLLRRLSDAASKIKGYVTGAYKIVADIERGNEKFIRDEVAAVGESGLMKQEVGFSAKDARERLRAMRLGREPGLEDFAIQNPRGLTLASKGTGTRLTENFEVRPLRTNLKDALISDDRVLQLMFDNEGLKRLRAADVERVKAGLPPMITPLHEKIHSSISGMMDALWTDARAYGLISEEAFRENYMTQLLEGTPQAINEVKRRTMSMGKGQTFSFAREFDNMFAAVEAAKEASAKTGKKLYVYPKYKGLLDNYVAASNMFIDAIKNAKIIEAAKRIPGGFLSEAQFEKAITNKLTLEDGTTLGFADRNNYHKVSGAYGNFYVRDDLWAPGRKHFQETPTGGFMSAMQTIKRVVLMADFRHAFVTLRIAVTHPGVVKEALLHPGMYAEAWSKKLADHPYLRGYVEAGGTPFIGGIGDYGNVNGILEQSGVRHVIDASHKAIFDQLIPVQRQLVAMSEIERLMRLREKGSGFRPLSSKTAYKDMTDQQIFRTAVRTVEPTFGRFDSQLSPRQKRGLQLAFLAPEWNMSIARMTLNSLREVGFLARGEKVDPYFTKRFAGMVGVALATTAAANHTIRKIANTDYDGDKDWFRLVLPWKDPVTGKNIRLRTLGPQFEFWKHIYDVVDYEIRTKKASIGTLGRAALQEIADTATARVHAVWRVPAMMVAQRVSATQAISESIKSQSPFTIQPYTEFADEYFGSLHRVSPQAKSRAIGSLMAMTTYHEAPQLAKEDFEVTSAAIAMHRARAAHYKSRGMVKEAAEQLKAIKDTKASFVNRYAGTDYFQEMAPFIRKLGR